jgi:Ca2+-binding EF-hand superfamily protein
MKKAIRLTGLWLVMTMVLLEVSAQKDKDLEKGIRESYKTLLKETDKDKDGKISKTEFYAIWKDKKVAEEKYKAWDLNKDGFITEDEYAKAVLDMGKKKK